MKTELSAYPCAERLCSLVGLDGYQYGRTEFETRDAIAMHNTRLKTMITRWFISEAADASAEALQMWDSIQDEVRADGKSRLRTQVINAFNLADRVAQNAMQTAEDADRTQDADLYTWGSE